MFGRRRVIMLSTNIEYNGVLICEQFNRSIHWSHNPRQFINMATGTKIMCSYSVVLAGLWLSARKLYILQVIKKHFSTAMPHCSEHMGDFYDYVLYNYVFWFLRAGVRYASKSNLYMIQVLIQYNIIPILKYVPHSTQCGLVTTYDSMYLDKYCVR